MAYNIVSTTSKMKSPYKRPIVTWDNYQVTLKVIRKRAVHIIKENIQIVAINSHTGADFHATPLVNCLVDNMPLQPEHATVRRCFRSATEQHRVLACGNHAPAWRPRLYIVNWNQVRTILWPHAWGNDVRCLVFARFYKVQYEHIKLRCDMLYRCVCFPEVGLCYCQEFAKLDDIW